MTAIFSIHDVMPETLEAVADLIDRVRAAGLPLPALLVVPGRAWDGASLARLRGWQADGAELVAHGWLHRTTPRRLYHRLHALLLSRDVAEHLAEDREGVRGLMLRSRDWFATHDLSTPDTYIPPAWALGMPARYLSALPFRCVETLRGVYLRDGDSIRHQPLPLLGFEADTVPRARFLRFWNARQARSAERQRRPLRISIHPQDAELLLREDLEQVLGRAWRPLSYAALPDLL